MTPTERTMPVIVVVGPRPDRRYEVRLPGDLNVTAPSRAAAEAIVAKHASGSSIRFVPWTR